MDAIALTCGSNLYFHSLQMQFQPPSQLYLHQQQQQQHSPYFPSLQMQFQPPPPPPPQSQYPHHQHHSSSSSSCIIGMSVEDDELLNLAASATCGFNFEENMVLDYSINNNYEHSNCCFPECYCNLKLPFHGDMDSFIHFADQQLQPLETLNSSSPYPNLETSPKTLTNEAARKPGLSVVINNEGDRKRVTAQSLAARERRRKITRKTQELGKLVPGGAKMNTAEMLHSAFKYIQFLQSQLQLLQLMNNTFPTFQGSEEKAAPALQMVASPMIQEKLYMEGYCVITRAFAKTLLHNTNDSSITEELRGIID